MFVVVKKYAYRESFADTVEMSVVTKNGRQFTITAADNDSLMIASGSNARLDTAPMEDTAETAVHVFYSGQYDDLAATVAPEYEVQL